MNSGADSAGLKGLPPLALYVHLPWCVRKCPYCDFNSHQAPEDLPLKEYSAALLADLELDLPDVWGRTVSSVFFGGGTPSLFKAEWYADLLSELRSRTPFSPDVEITLEANPGTTERDSFTNYRSAGINRVSLGVQSFSDRALQRIGRIHGRAEVDRSIGSIHDSGLENFNIDLMYALPGQTIEESLYDVRQAIACRPAHVSHYQLTLEPNTAFHATPPVLPGPDEAWAMQDACGGLLDEAGFHQYEVSAWAAAGRQCRHNLNYWQYGDFLGIGAGAHSKITLPSQDGVRRRTRLRHPKAWLQAAPTGDFIAQERVIDKGELIFEFFLNQLRLRDGIPKSRFTERTGLPWAEVSDRVAEALRRGLLEDCGAVLKPTEPGWRFINETQEIFLPGEAGEKH